MNETVTIETEAPAAETSAAETIEAARDLGYALAKLEGIEARALALEGLYAELRDDLAAKHQELNARMDSANALAATASETAASTLDALAEIEEAEDIEEAEEVEEAEEIEEAASVEEAAAAEAALAAAQAVKEDEPVRKKRGFISLLHSD